MIGKEEGPVTRVKLTNASNPVDWHWTAEGGFWRKAWLPKRDRRTVQAALKQWLESEHAPPPVRTGKRAHAPEWVVGVITSGREFWLWGRGILPIHLGPILSQLRDYLYREKGVEGGRVVPPG